MIARVAVLAAVLALVLVGAEVAELAGLSFSAAFALAFARLGHRYWVPVCRTRPRDVGFGCPCAVSRPRDVGFALTGAGSVLWIVPVRRVAAPQRFSTKPWATEEAVNAFALSATRPGRFMRLCKVPTII